MKITLATGKMLKNCLITRVGIIVVLFFLVSNIFAKPCVGRFVNPVTDICFSCMLPITVGPMPNLSSQLDTKNPSNPICLCKRPKIPVSVPGIPISLWEAIRLVDITRTPYCMVGLGGVSMGGSVKGHGGVDTTEDGSQSSFYNLHYYVYPLIYWLELLTDFGCMEQSSFDVAYMSEFDLSWNNDELAALLNPEAILSATPILQASCAADCVAATVGFPIDALKYCAGCQGSVHPFGGTVSSHTSGQEAALLLLQRKLARDHRMGLAWKTSGKEALCEKKLCFFIPKKQYKTQMVYPKAHTNSKTACNPLGRTSFFYGIGREYPYKGEDFCYLVFRKRNCCMTKATTAAVGL